MTKKFADKYSKNSGSSTPATKKKGKFHKLTALSKEKIKDINTIPDASVGKSVSAIEEQSEIKPQKPKKEEIKNDLSDDEEVEDQSEAGGLSLKEKEYLSERVTLLAQDGLASLVRLVQKEKPKAIEDIDNDRLQIIVKELDKKTFYQINQ